MPWSCSDNSSSKPWPMITFTSCIRVHQDVQFANGPFEEKVAVEVEASIVLQDKWLKDINRIKFICNHLINKVLNLLDTFNLADHFNFTSTTTCFFIKLDSITMIGPENMLPCDSIFYLCSHFLNHFPYVCVVHNFGLLRISKPHLVCHIRNNNLTIQVFWCKSCIFIMIK